MPSPIFALIAAATLAAAAGAAAAQFRLLVADRDTDSIRIMVDRNRNGVIDEPDEVDIYYNGDNAQGTPGPLNPNSIGVTREGFVLVGDQDAASRHWLVLRDLGGDALAQSLHESNIGVGPGNAAGASFAAPTGCAEGPDGRIFLVNAGNGFGPDQIWIATFGSDDHDAMDEDEVVGWVTINGFGTNGTFSPAEIAFGEDGALYMRNTGNAGNNIFRLFDLNGSGFIDESDEFVIWYGVGNAPGTPTTAGFALERDPTRARSFYTLQIATGGVDQLVRATDVGDDGDAQGDGESAIVWSTSEAGFNAVDILALPDGRVLISDTSGNRILALRDLTNDGDFSDSDERSTFFANTSSGLAALRGMAALPCPGDFNRDFLVFPDDLSEFITCFFLSVQFPGTCPRADFNQDGLVFPDDLSEFIATFFLPC